MKIKRWFVKRIVESEFLFGTCLGISLSLFVADIFYILWVYKITLPSAIILLICGFVLWFGSKCEMYRMKMKLD